MHRKAFSILAASIRAYLVYKRAIKQSMVALQLQIEPSVYDHAAGEPRSRSWIINPHQLDFLRDAFDVNPYPNRTTKQEFAQQLGLNCATVDRWFRGERTNIRKGKTPVSGSICELFLTSTLVYFCEI